MKRILPLIIVEGYLILSLVFLFFGPVKFKLHNVELFLIYMFIYHVAFVLGYYLSLRSFYPRKHQFENKFSGLKFYSLLSFGILSILITYKNIMLSESIIPFNIFSEFKNGIFEPGAIYSERMERIAGGGSGGSRIMNLLSLLFSFTKMFFLFYLIFYWKDLSFIKKMLSFFYCFLFLSPGISAGTNSVVFLFFIFIFITLVLIGYLRRSKSFNFIVIFSVLLAFIPVGFFGYIMSQRGGGFEYFSTISPLGDISIEMSTPSLDSVFGFYQYSLVWLSTYILQGYYGFSLILGMELNWTFGFGNSAFLQRQFLMITNIDISDWTFQSRISHLWDKDAQWHSFYGQVANDFGFIGVAFLMLFLGFFFSRVWLTVVFNKSFYGVALLPLFTLMFLFFPANNQVFGYIDTLSYFTIVGFLWLFEGKRIKFL